MCRHLTSSANLECSNHHKWSKRTVGFGRREVYIYTFEVRYTPLKLNTLYLKCLKQNTITLTWYIQVKSRPNTAANRTDRHDVVCLYAIGYAFLAKSIPCEFYLSPPPQKFLSLQILFLANFSYWFPCKFHSLQIPFLANSHGCQFWGLSLHFLSLQFPPPFLANFISCKFSAPDNTCITNNTSNFVKYFVWKKTWRNIQQATHRHKMTAVSTLYCILYFFDELELCISQTLCHRVLSDNVLTS